MIQSGWCPRPEGHSQQHTYFPFHHCHVQQGFANSHVPIVGHDGEEKDLSAGKEVQEEHLGDAGLKEDELLF